MTTAPVLQEGEVHIYCRTIPHANSELMRTEHHLSISERARADLLKNIIAKRSYITGRSMLREILGGYLHRSPEDVQLASGEFGKPFLVNGEKSIEFSVSHTGNILLLAVTTGHKIGIDIESIDMNKPFDDMAKLAFSNLEQEALSNIRTPHMKCAAFYRYWVRKEACLKACGRGFSLLSNSFEVMTPYQDAPLFPARCNNSDWRILDINVPPPYCASLAYEIRTPELQPPVLIMIK